MRGPVLLLVLLVATPALSGCIFALPQDPEPLPLVAPGWETPQALESRPISGAYGVWVPDDTTALRARWAGGAVNLTTEAETDTSRSVRSGDDDVHADAPRNVLGHFPDLLVVVAPDGTWRYAGSGSVRLPLGNDTGVRPPALPRDVLFQDTPPLPGLYRIVVYGSHAIPLIELKTATTDTRIAPAAPLPLIVDTTILAAPTGPGEGMLGTQGQWSAPEGTVAVWGDLRGNGIDGRLKITNSEGATVADHRRRALADGLGTLDGLMMPRFTDSATISPDALYDRTLDWTTSGTGIATVYGFSAIVPDVAAPWISPRQESEAADPDSESTPLEGKLERWKAGGFVLPDNARVRLVLSDTDSESRDHTRYRIYSADGQRLAWGTLDRAGARLTLPPGPLAIVNDGPGSLEVHVDGTAPTDAVLHPLETKQVEHRTGLGTPTGGPSEERIRAVYDAPAVALHLQHSGAIENVHLAVLRTDGAPLATAPDLAPYRAGTRPCCSLPGYGGGSADPYWLDPGIHHLRIRAAAGQGDVAVYSILVDLAALHDLVQDGN